MSSANVEKALALMQEKRPDAIDDALALLQNTVYSFSMRVCGHPQDAEDTMQDVLIKLFPYLPKFDSPQALSVWLYKVARNRCLMNRRGAKNARGKHVSLDELMPTNLELKDLLKSTGPNPEANVLRAETRQQMREAVLKVPPLYRMVLVLHDMEGLSTSEVARVVGVREGTVRVRLHRARLLLRKHLAHKERPKEVPSRRTHAPAGEEPVKRLRHCREMFAALSDYMDGLVDDEHTREMQKHLSDCQPCVAFLDSLKWAVEQCRTYAPSCDPTRAEELRRDLLDKYRSAVASLPKTAV
jgi:RNA polymerase sigma-70 factor (ECF subfamily)